MTDIFVEEKLAWTTHVEFPHSKYDTDDTRGIVR